MRRCRVGGAAASAAAAGVSMVVMAVTFPTGGGRAHPGRLPSVVRSAAAGVLDVGHRGVPRLVRGDLALLDTDDRVDELAADGGVLRTDVEGLDTHHGPGVDLADRR